MKKFIKNFLFLFLFNLFIIIFCQNKFDVLDGQCLKLLLYYNGTVIRKNESLNNNNFTDTTFSIATYDKIILFDCLNKENENVCSYRNATNNSISLEDCKKKSTDINNYCCFINERYYDIDNNISNSGCIQVDKNEYERFKSNKYLETNNHALFNYYGRLECFSPFYIQKINIISIIAIILIYF